VSRDVILTAEGRQPPEYYAGLMDMLGTAYRKRKEAFPGSDISLADLVPLVDDPVAPRLADYVARNWMAEDDLSLVSCDELFAENGYGPGGPQVMEGMSAVIGKMADELRAGGVVIRTATPVQAADQSGDAVLLSSPDGRAFEAAAGVITASVGVLKKGLIDFTPKLAAPITDYFNGLSMGKMTKVIVPLNDEFFERRGIEPNTFVSVMTDENKTFCHARSAGAPVIEVFAAGAQAEELEKDPAAAAAFAGKFFAALGDYFAGWEENVAGPPFISTFNTDPYILGSYSSAKPGGKRADPMRDGRLFFAGEAFITTDENGREPSATMSAAWSSGRKVAADVFTAIRPLLAARQPGQGIQAPGPVAPFRF